MRAIPSPKVAFRLKGGVQDLDDFSNISAICLANLRRETSI